MTAAERISYSQDLLDDWNRTAERIAIVIHDARCPEMSPWEMVGVLHRSEHMDEARTLLGPPNR